MDYAEMLVWETEGRRGAAERGWLGSDERQRELERQEREYQEYLRSSEDRCPCGGVILADTDDWKTPICIECWYKIGSPSNDPEN